MLEPLPDYYPAHSLKLMVAPFLETTPAAVLTAEEIFAGIGFEATAKPTANLMTVLGVVMVRKLGWRKVTKNMNIR